MSSGPNRNLKKACPACKREFVGTLVVCQHDGTLLIPVKESLVGQILANKYKVLEVVGHGGMSIVYKGHQENIDRIVAIKMLQAGLAQDETSKRRFQQEAQAVAFLQHPNIITLYDSDIFDNQPYLVMDFLVGESMTDIIKRENHVGVDRVIGIFVQACDALEHAHRKGVIHRDLKSSNIMLLETEGKKDFVKVVDFGIAKLMPSSGKQAQNLTQTGEIFGSPIYMSPEQCKGELLDARSDIYSTGVMMYEALTGQPPLMGDTIIDTMQMHVQTRPPAFAEMRPDLHIPAALEKVVFRSLEKNPDDRYQSMQDMRDHLEHVAKKIAGEEYAPPTAGPRANRPERSTRQNLSASMPPGSGLPKPTLDSGPSSRPSREAAVATPRAEVSSARRNADNTGSGMQSFKVSELRKMDEHKAKAETTSKYVITIVVLSVALIAVVALLLLKVFTSQH